MLYHMLSRGNTKKNLTGYGKLSTLTWQPSSKASFCPSEVQQRRNEEGQFPPRSQMQYRNFDQIDFQPSALGFGAMRLPTVDDDSSKIDKKQAKQMIYYAIDKGVNYLDTAYVYHQGQSEVFLGEALKNGYRQKVKIATKLPVWMVEKKNDFDKFLDEELTRLQTDHIDFYLLHNLNKEKWLKVQRLNLTGQAEKAILNGKINHLGFSFHDDFPVFKEIVDGYDKWEFCLIQYNFMDENIQAGKTGLKYAAEKGLAVIVMEPLKGGRLASAPPSVQKIWDKAKIKRTPAEWALSWVWNQPEVSLLLSGMSTLPQVEANIKSVEKSKIGMLSREELALFEKAKKEYEKLFPLPCTDCRYCLPCPQGVNIPKVFEIYNHSFAFRNLGIEKKQYRFLPPEERAENCLSCRRCESLCPQKIKITEKLKEVGRLLGNN